MVEIDSRWRWCEAGNPPKELGAVFGGGACALRSVAPKRDRLPVSFIRQLTTPLARMLNALL